MKMTKLSMDETKYIAKKIINTIPLEIHTCGNNRIVGIKYGFCKEADDMYGRSVVLAVLNALETDNELYEELL
jgi:hypothetical protein